MRDERKHGRLKRERKGSRWSHEKTADQRGCCLQFHSTGALSPQTSDWNDSSHCHDHTNLSQSKWIKLAQKKDFEAVDFEPLSSISFFTYLPDCGWGLPNFLHLNESALWGTQRIYINKQTLSFCPMCYFHWHYKAVKEQQWETANIRTINSAEITAQRDFGCCL